MTETEVCAAVETYLDTNWAETPILFDQVLDRPDDHIVDLTSWDEEFGDAWDKMYGASWRTNLTGEYVSLKIISAGTVQTAVGSFPEWRGSCILDISINVPSGTGTRRAVKLGDQISELFLGQDLDGITVRDKVIYQTIVGRFYRRTVRFNGFYTYTH